jgi:hypothetical protein
MSTAIRGHEDADNEAVSQESAQSDKQRGYAPLISDSKTVLVLDKPSRLSE